jgi:carbon storage regulator CsrA
MLALSRKINEVIRIIDTATNTEILVMKVNGIDRQNVRLGFNADRRYLIVRDEAYKPVSDKTETNRTKEGAE